MQQAIELFDSIYKEQETEIILDNYLLSDGLYIIAANNKINQYNIQYKESLNKKDKNIQFLILADYYSKLISINKPVDKKKLIKSNNYLSFIINQKNLKDKEKLNNSIELYYNKIKEQATNEQIELINNNQLWIKTNLTELEENCTNKGSLKIFFKPNNWQEEYKKESIKYLSQNIFNATVKGKNDEILGVPNDIKLSPKKPYTMNKSRKTEYPLLATLEEAITRYNFFNYLECCAKNHKNNIYIDETRIIPLDNTQHLQDVKVFGFTGMFLRVDMTKMGVIIKDMDIISSPI